METENVVAGIIMVFVIGLIGVLIWAAVEDSHRIAEMKANTEIEYKECLKKESKYICEAYRNSVYAKIEAGEAANAANAAAFMGAASMGMNAGRR